jgi:predicted transport protein
LKYYIALKYKGTNLVSITPSGNGLKCWLSLEYSELHDSSGFKDVKNIGHWGTGNVEFNLISQTQIESLLKEITQVKTKIEQQVSESKELTPYKIWQRNYWDEFRNYCLEKQFSMNPSATLRPAKPNSDYRLLTEVAHTVSYVAKLHDKKSLACGLIFKTKTHDLYEIALRHKTEVEQIFEDQILFQSYDKSDYLYIYGQSHGQLPDSDKTKEFEWYISSLAKFKEVLNKIKAKEWV